MVDEPARRLARGVMIQAPREAMRCSASEKLCLRSQAVSGVLSDLRRAT